MSKKAVAILLAVCMLIPALAMAAGTVTCIGCRINGQTAWNIMGSTVLTAIADRIDGYTPDYWTIDGEKVAGSENQTYLVFNVDGSLTVACHLREQTAEEVSVPEPTRVPLAAVHDEAEQKTVTAVGCVLKYLDSDGKEYGDEMTSLTFTGSVNISVTAAPAKGQKVSYWVINGVKYDFYEYLCKACTIKKLTYDLTVEVVYKNASSQTLGNVAKPDEDTLTVQCISSDMCFITSKGKGVGGWFDEFDFTGSYYNPALKKDIDNGTITLRVKADPPKGKKAVGWKINDAEFRFDSRTDNFYVYDLDRSTVYEPMVANATYTVTCKGCTFSGGGYTKAKKGTVPAGTKITVYPDATHFWNGVVSNENEKPRSYTINSDSTFTCIEAH